MDELIKILTNIRNNPPEFDNVKGDQAPELRRHAEYGWVKGLDRAINEFKSIPEMSEEGNYGPVDGPAD